MTEFDYAILGVAACLLVAFIVPVIIATWLALYDDLKRRWGK